MKEEVQKALEIIQNGGIILYPTDTVWGLGCDAQNQDAVEKIYRLKKRAEGKSFVVLASSENMVSKFIHPVPDIGWDMFEMSETPLTLVLDHAQNLAKGVKADDGSVAIRIIRKGFANQLIHKLGVPIVSTSANLSGDTSPANFAEISEAIKTGVDYITPQEYDQGNGKPSSIIRLWEDARVKIIRK